MRKRRYDPDMLNREFSLDSVNSHEAINPLIRLWIYRIMVPLGGMRELVQGDYFRHEGLARVLGLEKWLELDENASEDLDKNKIVKELRCRYTQVEQEAAELTLPESFNHNMTSIATLVNLSDVDTQILAFALMLHIDPLLEAATEHIGNLSTMKAVYVLSLILKIPENDVRKALHPQGILAKSGLVVMDRDGSAEMRRKLDILSGSFADCIYSSIGDPIELLRDMVSPATPANISIDDYEHIQPELNVLLPYVKNCITARKKGVNILVYGKPGTGKTQLSKVVANINQCELFEISCEDSDGDAFNGKQRLSAYKAAQYFFSSRASMLVFDEAEDIFSGGNSFFSPPSIAQSCKGWMNKMLEENAVPTFWLTNSIRGIDSAFIRRFDMIIHMPTPPKIQREKIIKKQCGDLIGDRLISHFAETTELTQAVMEKNASIIRAIKDELPAIQIASSLELLVNATLKSQKHATLPKFDEQQLPNMYNPAFINADSQLDEVAQGLKRSKSGRLCLFGPPGTGKTAYGKWLAEQLDMPLLVRRASDLMDMYVGNTEKNIAAAFKQAERENAILLVDEVDSFLRNRREAVRSWEVSAVNEMLTQMETFPGIFIASTNLMDGLDQASLRRFDLKVKFDYLLPQQAWLLCQAYCAQLAIPAPDDLAKCRLDRLKNITPGDYAAVARQSRFKPIKTAQELVKALEAECSMKALDSGKGIGFLTH